MLLNVLNEDALRVSYHDCICMWPSFINVIGRNIRIIITPAVKLKINWNYLSNLFNFITNKSCTFRIISLYHWNNITIKDTAFRIRRRIFTLFTWMIYNSTLFKSTKYNMLQWKPIVYYFYFTLHKYR